MKDNIFNSILVERPPRNHFDLSHTKNISFNMGKLVPCSVIDVVPGDSFTIGTESFLRFAPMIAPIMEKVNVTAFWFFCPIRILYDDPRDWEDFITGQGTEGHIAPFLESISGTNVGKMVDHLYNIEGTPGGMRLSAHYIAAYCKIYDEWFRNQNTDTTETWEPLITNNNHNGVYRPMLQGDPFTRTWEKDYFTSALPWAQKGSAVSLPLLEQGSATVTLSGVNTPGTIRNASDGSLAPVGDNLDIATGSAFNSGTGNNAVFYDPEGTLEVDINSAAATINQLRQAYRLQEWLELDAMGGTRYTEKIYAHFGVKSPDARLQRPEFIGRYTGRMAISEVLQTSAANDDGETGRGTPLGTMGGHGLSVMGGSPLNYYATEHGILMCIINVQPKPKYQQGLARKFTRFLPLDYYWPKFANIGEQEILNQEIFVQSASPNGTFGYASRYAEYKFEASTVAGEMRTTLAHWHLGRIFASAPALNKSFTDCDPSPRIFNTLYTGGGEPEYNSDQIFGLIHHNIHAMRLMPKYARPTI